MKNFVLIKWLNNVSLTRKLYFVMGIMAVLIAVELFTLSFMIHTLSSTRALVGAEGLWSKAEKDAVFNLTQYAYTHDEKAYQQYQALLAVPEGDHVARLELLKPNPDKDVIRSGFLKGRFNEDDIDGVIKLLRRFHSVSYINKAIGVWTDGDKNIATLQYLGDRLHKQISSGTSPDVEIKQTIDQINLLNQNLTSLEDTFSFTLGEGSRWVEHLILTILFIIAITVEFTGLFLTISVSTAISRGIKEIVRVARNVAHSDYKSRAKIFSGDEIGVLANSFNNMIERLQKKMEEERLTREALHRQKELYETLITAQSQMGEGVCITEADKIVYVNDAICNMYGFTREELLKLESFTSIVPAEERLMLRQRLEQRVNGKRTQSSGETKIIRKDGGIIDVEYTVQDLFTNGKKQLISIIRDVTDKKMGEALLRMETARAERAELSKKIGEQFLANMSHEIRTPMNAILGFTEILAKTELSADQQNYLDSIKLSGDNLLVIINDILDFSRMRSGKMPIEKKDFNLQKVLNSCIELMRPKADEKKLQLRLKMEESIPENLVGDYTRLMQVLLNLVANAIKFTAEGSVSVTVKMLNKEEKAVQLQLLVEDTGIGIPPDHLDTIFDAFIQVNNETARTYGGTGLGLAIVKQLADLQQGSVSVTSTEGKGSCFDFRIKYGIGSAQVENGEEAEEQPKAIGKLHVLLAEDNTMNQVLARKVLTDWGWEVKIAENGEEAVELVKENDFDVVLMDIQLPKMDGYQATQQIRSILNEPKRSIPIIAMTACAMHGEQEKCFKVGMDGYVSKPFDTKNLYANISKALRKVG
jgi:PAS domain S-box-containing protein